MAEPESRLREVVKKIVEEQEYQDCEIELKPISSGGANYTSQLFTVRLSAPGKDDLKLFAKIATLGEKIRSMSNMQVFETELLFYTKILPKYKELEAAHNFPEAERLVLPKYYGGTAEYMKEVLVLEDFSVKGYKTFDRFKCFDWEYAASCVSVLAELHALSVAFEKEDPEGYLELIGSLQNRVSLEQMRGFLNKSIVTAIKVTDEIYRERVEHFFENCMKKDTFVKFFQPERRLFLIHGDFRPSNILHKIGDDGQLSVVLLDHQVMQRGNPVTDLLYFLITGSDEEFRSKHLHQFFNHYYETFSKILQRLGINSDDVYSEVDYRNDVKEILPFGLTLSTFMLPLITVAEDTAPKPEDCIDFDSFDIEINELFGRRFNGLVRDYVKWGIL